MVGGSNTTWQRNLREWDELVWPMQWNTKLPWELGRAKGYCVRKKVKRGKFSGLTDDFLYSVGERT